MATRGLWPFTTFLFLATTLLFVYLTLHFRNQATQVAPIAPQTVAEVDAPRDRQPKPERELPPPRTPSGWETEIARAPMANVPVYDLGHPGSPEPANVEIKTTVHWLLFLYTAPRNIRRPELLIRGPGDKVYWGAGPLPDMEEGEARSLVIPGDYLPMGGYYLAVRGTDGETLRYGFKLTRKRYPGEWKEGEGEEAPESG